MISVDWGTQVIFVPKSYTQFVSFGVFEIRQLDINQFRLDLKTLESGLEGIPHLITHTHNSPVTVGGVTLARVVEVINGYTITFEDGAYGLNLVGANSNIADVTNLNSVQIRSANSAGLTFSEEINSQSFLGKVWLFNSPDHPNEGLPGVQFPRGTPTDPVNNWLDANFIAEDRRLHNYHLDGHLVFTGQTESVIDISGNTIEYIARSNLSHTGWEGFSPFSTHITSPLCSSGNSQCIGGTISADTLNGFVDSRRTNINNANFNKLSIDGYYAGIANFYDCLIANSNLTELPAGHTALGFFDGFNGEMENCGIGGSIIICNSVSAVDTIEFRNCYDITPTGDEATFDFTLMSNSIARFSGWHGGLYIQGVKDGDDLTINIDTGDVKIDLDTCTGGTIHIRGLCHIELCSSGKTVCEDLNIEDLGKYENGETTGLTLDTKGVIDPAVVFSELPTIISQATWNTITSSSNPGTYGELLNILLTNSEVSQHTLNVQTEMLNNKPNNC